MPAGEKDIGWLVRLRWGAVAGQLAAMTAVRFLLESSVPAVPLAAVIAVTVCSNFWLYKASGGRRAEAITGWVMALDIVLLTVLLYWTGGPGNPFSVLYLVHVTLSAVMLTPRWTWGLALLSAAGFGFLFFHHVPLEAFDHSQHMSMDHAGHEGHEGHEMQGGDTFSLHLQGMWFAYVCVAGLIAWLVLAVSEQLRRRERELAAARDLAARNERLASLATLAAGAAHELGSPLGTIAIAAGELERSLAASDAAPDLVADAALIRAEVKRSRRILDALAEQAGAPAGEAPLLVGAEELLGRAAEGIDGSQIRWMPGAGVIEVPVSGVLQAIRNLVKNAVDASPAGSSVEVTAGAGPDGQFAIVVTDRGTGMDGATLSRAGEPFFTTKPEGKGMGLGLFLARSVAERLNGRLKIESQPGHGTVVRLEFPAADGQTGGR